MLLPLLILATIVLVVAATRFMVERIEAANAPRGTFAILPGGKIHVQRRDPAGAVRGDVVLIHGASGNGGDVMEALGEKLAVRGFRIWAPDRPGHGWSDRWPDSASPARQATLIRAALESLGVREAIVLGHSLAGAVADNFAIDHGDFARGVVLVSPVTHPWPGGIDWIYNVASFGPLGKVFAATVVLPVGLLTIEKVVKAVFSPQEPPADYVDRTQARLVLRPAEFVANAEDVAKLADFVAVQAPREAGIKVPVAIVAGDETDKIVSTNIHSVASAKAISGATLTILPGVGHSPQWSAPDVVVTAIEDVFARASGRASAAAN